MAESMQQAIQTISNSAEADKRSAYDTYQYYSQQQGLNPLNYERFVTLLHNQDSATQDERNSFPVLQGWADAFNAQNTSAQVTPGSPQTPNQINITDYGGQLATDPSQGLLKDNPLTPQNESMFLQDHVSGIDENATGTNIDPTAQKYGMDAGALDQQAAQGTAAVAAQVDPRTAANYDAQQTQQNIVDNGQATAAQGTVSQGAQIDAPTLDTEAIGQGQTETGKALDDFASLDIDDVNAKATLKGQLDILQSEFQDDQGNPVIPIWAQGTARGVQKIAAFKGMTGSAATEAMANALMEASIGVAQQDAQFFQTLTLQNLSNEQASIINKANVLSKMDLANQDSRLAAAIQNSKAFLEMDLTNLANEQQAEVINTQARIQSIFEDAKAVNTQRLFEADSTNEMNKFYDELNTRVSEFNAAQQNAMEQFNVSEDNGMKQFNSQLEDSREKFYKEMQYNIDLANAKWRQTVTLSEAEMEFEAAATDVQNMLGISTEQLNQVWDRSDALLDYLWKSTENELDRKQRLIEIDRAGEINSSLLDSQGSGKMWGTILGSVLSNDAVQDGIGSLFDWIF